MINKTPYLLAAITFCIIFQSLFLSCVSQKQNSSITFIRYGKSFGMCEGYCFNEKEIDRKASTSISKAQGRGPQKFPDKSNTIKTTSDQWRLLVAKINLSSFLKLPERIGCPDCADGGAEWIEVGTQKKSHKVVFEKGADIKQLRDLLGMLRQ